MPVTTSRASSPSRFAAARTAWCSLTSSKKRTPTWLSILLQILDDGRVTDAKGRTIDFRHALIILTTNLEEGDVPIALRSELLDRIDDVVPFEALDLEHIEAIVTIHVDALGGAPRCAQRQPAPLRRGQGIYLARVSMGAGSGARYVQRTVSHYVSTPLSTALLRGELRDGGAAEVTLEGDALPRASRLERFKVGPIDVAYRGRSHFRIVRKCCSPRRRSRHPASAPPFTRPNTATSMGPPLRAFYGKRATPPAVAGESASATGALIAFESVVHEPPP